MNSVTTHLQYLISYDGGSHIAFDVDVPSLNAAAAIVDASSSARPNRLRTELYAYRATTTADALTMIEANLARTFLASSSD